MICANCGAGMWLQQDLYTTHYQCPVCAATVEVELNPDIQERFEIFETMGTDCARSQRYVRVPGGEDDDR